MGGGEQSVYWKGWLLLTYIFFLSNSFSFSISTALCISFCRTLKILHPISAKHTKAMLHLRAASHYYQVPNINSTKCTAADGTHLIFCLWLILYIYPVWKVTEILRTSHAKIFSINHTLVFFCINSLLKHLSPYDQK